MSKLEGAQEAVGMGCVSKWEDYQKAMELKRYVDSIVDIFEEAVDKLVPDDVAELVLSFEARASSFD